MGDLIERQAAIDLINDIDLINFTAKGIVRDRLRKLPSAQPERKNVRGEWVERKDVYPHKPDGEITSWGYKCSRCNQLSQLKYNFCFNCGADMRGE